MGCFHLPEKLIHDLNSLMASFWWGNSSDKKDVHWMSWDRLWLPKSKGGMSFRSLEDFNCVLLAQ